MILVLGGNFKKKTKISATITSLYTIIVFRVEFENFAIYEALTYALSKIVWL